MADGHLGVLGAHVLNHAEEEHSTEQDHVIILAHHAEEIHVQGIQKKQDHVILKHAVLL